MKIITFDSPIVVTKVKTAESVELLSLVVNVRGKTCCAVLESGEVAKEILLWSGKDYDSSGITDFWPAVEARIKALASVEKLF